MRKIALALAGASVAIAGVAATPASAQDFRGRDRGRVEQVQTRQVMTNRFVDNNSRYGGFTGNRYGGVANARFNGFANNRFQSRDWHRGDRFDSRYAADYSVIGDPDYYNLQPAPYGYRWVRSGDNAVLVAIASGLIGALVANAF